MKLLHLCSDYPFTNIYRELLSVIDKHGYNQIIYIPVKKDIDKSKRIDETLTNSTYIYSKTYNNIDRFFYHKKVNKILRDVYSNINLSEINLIHAHFLFSLGGVALKLKQEVGINYVVSIRNTDVNLFFKYGIWLREYALKIISEANNIVFISPSYKKRVFDNYIPRSLWCDIDRKSLILPNGVNGFWLQNKNTTKKALQGKKIRLVYTGELNKNKNLKTSIAVTKKLIEKGYDATLKIIGTGPDEKKIIRNAEKNKEVLLFYGFIENRSEIKKLYSESDIFIMPSFNETFGVVYIEAMSQGLPVIYSRNEGIDGFYADGVIGYAINPRDVDEIVARIEDICANYEQISNKCKNEADKYFWDKIGAHYINNILIPLQNVHSTWKVAK